MGSYIFPIPGGVLSIDTRREDMPLHSLLDFAARRNPKRHYLFVSKLLGKHIPCRPAQMRRTYDVLAASLSACRGPVFVVGMAETAVGLGGGVADSLARHYDRQDVVYQHTTRQSLSSPLWLTFDESHSHAPDHLVYCPRSALKASVLAAKTLVLVDDEITTGRTLELLAQRLLEKLPQVEQIAWVSLVNWLTPERQGEIQRSMSRVETRFISLLEGHFSFTRDEDFSVALPASASRQHSAKFEARGDLGRCGLHIPLGGLDTRAMIDVATLPSSDRCVVVGTGEFLLHPFLLAEQLEQQGRDVWFQSTTRSPIVQGGAIKESHSFEDEFGQAVGHYLHNPPSPSEGVLWCLEQPNCLPFQQNAMAGFASHPVIWPMDGLHG